MKTKLICFLFILAIISGFCGCVPVRIESTPSGAYVHDETGLIKLGTTPFDTHLIAKKKSFLIRKDHHFEKPVTITPGVPQKVKVTLYPKPILIESLPAATLFSADSDFTIGPTPLELGVSRIKRNYVLKAKDYFDKEITIDIETANPFLVRLDRRPFVTLSTIPTDVQIYENGERLGVTPFTQEIFSKRTFELRKKNYFPQTVTIEKTPPYTVTAKLKAFPQITVNATPPNTEVYCAGKRLGVVPVQLFVGKKMELELRADRFGSKSIIITPDSSSEINLSLQAKHSVTVSSSLPGTEIFSKGKRIGTAPLELLVETPEVIELRKDGFLTETVTLVGNSKRVHITLEKTPVEIIPVEEIAPPIVEIK